MHSLWIKDMFPLAIMKYVFMSSEHLRLRPPATAGDSGPVSVSALYNALIWRHAASPQQSLETVYRQFWGETAAAGTSSGVPHFCWKCEQTPLCHVYIHPLFVSTAVLWLFQVLQQECVDVESLDDVDSSGKTLLDRLTMPVIFPDGYVHYRHKRL